MIYFCVDKLSIINSIWGFSWLNLCSHMDFPSRDQVWIIHSLCTNDTSGRRNSWTDSNLQWRLTIWSWAWPVCALMTLLVAASLGLILICLLDWFWFAMEANYLVVGTQVWKVFRFEIVAVWRRGLETPFMLHIVTFAYKAVPSCRSVSPIESQLTICSGCSSGT